ncbi:hypothetical protein BCR42DRAFT_446451 [Absidia repens]|uniref:Uncharacterized protein n=1 Tax=Absidia repens TaxID=90262 RepID=A0A1X2IZ21_9FUNG|nr:hypothetical protein BCR42DRAFT_446451 [Absidia repens]
MKIYRKNDWEKKIYGDKNDGETCIDDTQQPRRNRTGTGSEDETQFMARMIALPLLQEGLSSTQSIASQSRIGRALLDRTHSIIQRFSRTIHRVKNTPTYQHYFRQDGYLQRSLVKVDGWACSSLDIIETRAPLLHQPTATIMDALIIQPRQQIRSALDDTWDLVITQPLGRLNGRINKDLDGVELWISKRNLDTGGDDDEDIQRINTSTMNINQRILLLSGSAFRLGLNQAAMTKKKYSEWTEPLFSQDAFPLARSIKSHFGTSLSDWKSRTHLATKTESTH